MAFLSKFAPLIFITAALCFLFVLQLHQLSDCNVESGCFVIQAAAAHEMHIRKLLGEKMVVLKKEVGNDVVGEGWGLREAPLGPDPLHHHGGSPTKPKTP